MWTTFFRRIFVVIQIRVLKDPGASRRTQQYLKSPAASPSVASISQSTAVIKMYCFMPTVVFCSGQDYTPPTLAPEPLQTTACLPNHGVDYVGDLAVTLGGHTCLPWSSPKVQELSKSKEFMAEVNLLGNKCRNPDNDPEGPWCYVEVFGNLTIDFCDIDVCGK